MRKLWPHLLNELISVFEVKQGETMDKENTDLTIEAIKLVELLSSLNIEDFQMNQWIFLIDGYGMQLETNEKVVYDDSKSISRPSGKMSSELKKSSLKAPGLNTDRGTVADNTDVFKTFIVRFIGNQEYSFYNVETPNDGMLNQDFEYDIRDLAYASLIESDNISASPQSIGQQPQSNYRKGVSQFNDSDQDKTN